jgi:hypothetical protein
MRLLRLALCVACLPLAVLRAADDQKEEEKQAPDEIPNFSQLDEYIYVPKSTLSIGTRFFIRGPKTTYSGQGINPSVVDPGADNTVGVPNISRTYIDGTIYPDSRTTTINAGLGGVAQVPIQSDGRTNSWTYDFPAQLLPNGDIAFHTYSSEITDTSSHDVSSNPNAGIELILDRDMGKIGKKMTWSWTVGFSIADIHSSSYLSVPTTVTTLTDTYDLFGQVPPAAPFTSPNNITQTVFGAAGTVVAGTSSAAASQDVVQQILIGDKPIEPGGRVTSSVLSTSTNRYFIEGAYYTLRMGPTLTVPVGGKYKLNLSVGPALIYSGSTYNVLEDLFIATGEDFPQLYQKENNRLLPGYYAEANLQYQLNDTSGLYVGAVYQGAGSYRQTVASGTAADGTPLAYSTKIDFGGQEGVKGGLTVRF